MGKSRDMKDAGGKAVQAIVLDFDGTVIREHILTNWVVFLLLNRELGPVRKMRFLFSSMCRGFLSICFSSFPMTAEYAVKTAFMAFRGIKTDTVEKLICHPSPFRFRLPGRIRSGNTGDERIIHLNPSLLPLLRQIMADADRPEIRICSQGSFPLAIRSFLQREDVQRQLGEIGIAADSIILDVNEPETDRTGCFTGRLTGKVRTKYRRVHDLDENCVFIGDDADERAIRKAGADRLRFINWKTWWKTWKMPEG